VRGHAIATVVWIGLLAGGWYLVDRSVTSTPAVRGCGDEGRSDEIVLAVAADGHFYIDGAVNGTAVSFVVDTGASNVTVGGRWARQAGLSEGLPAFFNTANGRVEGRLVPRQKVRAACLEVDDITVAVSPGLDQIGLLGQNFLRRFEVVQTARELRLRLRPPASSP
jgi:aspartyl protease family protein